MELERKEKDLQSIQSSEVSDGNGEQSIDWLESREGKRAEQIALKDEINSLHQKRNQVYKERAMLDLRINKKEFLSAAEQQEWQELEDQMEALDAEIEYKTERINTQENQQQQQGTTRGLNTEEEFLSRTTRIIEPQEENEVSLITRKYVQLALQLKQMEVEKEQDQARMKLMQEEHLHEMKAMQAQLQEATQGAQQTRKDYEAKVKQLEKSSQHLSPSKTSLSTPTQSPSERAPISSPRIPAAVARAANLKTPSRQARESSERRSSSWVSGAEAQERPSQVDFEQLLEKKDRQLHHLKQLNRDLTKRLTAALLEVEKSG